jgi:hypothetical protein
MTQVITARRYINRSIPGQRLQHSIAKTPVLLDILIWCSVQFPFTFESFELPSWMVYQAVQLLWDSGLGRGESGYSL